MDAVEICQDGIPIPGHAAETTLCEMHDTMDVKVHPNMEKKKKKKRKASEAGGRNFTDWYESTGELLGEGAFGHVTTYHHNRTNKEFAVKMILKTKERSRMKVLKEIEILIQCRGHPNIIYLCEFFEDSDRIFMIFEKLDGGTLLHNIWRRGLLREHDVSEVVKNIADGLFFLHQKGIAHRDLKPDNILCVHSDQLVPIKLIDFDLASSFMLDGNGSDVVTTPRLRSPVGSVDYMAPEVVGVWQDKGWSYDKRCDLWSLGVILYVLLCGYTPFQEHSCGQNCGWNRGLKCDACQNALFECIRHGDYSFPEHEWGKISDKAKDLVACLLVTNPCSRFSASDVLDHPWIKNSDQDCDQVLLSTTKQNSIQQLSACVDSVNEINRLVRLQLECESRTASVPATDLTCQLEVTISSRQQLADQHNYREAGLTDGDQDNDVCRNSDHSDEDTEDNGRGWASDYDDDDMVFQLSDIDDDDRRGTNGWADDTIQDISSSAWNGSFTQRLGDAVPPSFDDDSGNGYSCGSGSPCRPDSQLLTSVPSLPTV